MHYLCTVKYNLFSKDMLYKTLVQVYSSEFCEISKNTFFTEHLRTAASGQVFGLHNLRFFKNAATDGSPLRLLSSLKKYSLFTVPKSHRKSHFGNYFLASSRIHN